MGLMQGLVGCAIGGRTNKRDQKALFMSLPLILFLALVQGVTEFLPISSSGHLVLIWEGAELLQIPIGFNGAFAERAIDVAAHVGTLAAVMLFYWRDILQLAQGFANPWLGGQHPLQARRFWLLVLASVPLVIAGGIWGLFGPAGAERHLIVVGTASIFFGLVIWGFDARAPQTHVEADLTPRRAIVFGLFQVLALIPGTSRSGITMAAGRALGFTRQSGTKIALLMSIPAIAASGSLQAVVLLTSEPDVVPDGLWQTAGLVALFSALAAFATLAIFTKFLPKTGFGPYVIYRVLLGIAVIAVALAL